MKCAIISDTHWGVKNDSPALLDHFSTYFRKHFFPELERRGVKTIFHLGDLVDRRKYVNFKTAEVMRREFLEPAAAYDVHVLAGNHDVMYKNTNEVNALRELVMRRYERIKIYSNPAYATVPNGNDHTFAVALVPWICEENYRKTMEFIEGTKARYCLGHLELNGFKMYKNSTEMDHGFDPKPFEKFDAVLSGHFHHMSQKGNVIYVGAPYEMTWSDHDDPRGFHVLDTETLDLEHVRNPMSLHLKLHYEDGTPPPEEEAEGRIVKVIVKSREDGLAFDRFMKRLDAAAPADVQVVDDHLHLDVIAPEESGSVSVEDTPVILRQAVEELEGDVDKAALSRLMMDVYSEALSRR